MEARDCEKTMPNGQSDVLLLHTLHFCFITIVDPPFLLPIMDTIGHGFDVGAILEK